MTASITPASSIKRRISASRPAREVVPLGVRPPEGRAVVLTPGQRATEEPLRQGFEGIFDLADRVAPDRVRLGSLPGPQKALAAADLVVLPSRTEGMPGVLIEAGPSTRSAVASDVGG